MTKSVPGRATVTGSILQRPTLPARLLGIIRSPRGTFEHVVEHPRAAGALVVPTLAAAAAGAALFQTEVGRLALVDQWERTAVAFGQSIDDSAYARLQELSQSGPLYAIAAAVVNGPLLTFAVTVLIWSMWTLSNHAAESRPTWRQVLAVTAHAGIILNLRQVVAAPITYVRETTASATAMSLWSSLLDDTSTMARLLSMLDAFILWWTVVLAVGVSVLYRRPAPRLVTAFVGAYVGLAVLMALVMAALGGIEG